MNLWRVSKIMDRLNQMLDHAISGEPIETYFDETKMSALETKMVKYLQTNHMRSRELEEETLRVNELISDISHQTKTPISNLMLYLDLLKESSLTEQQLQYTAALTEQIDKLNFLIKSLMKISRLEHGIITVKPKVQSIQRLLKEVCILARPKAQKLGIDLCIESKEDIYVSYDLKWTTEALFNIVDNAIKYSNPKSKVCIRLISYTMFCRIDVVDTGIGIEKEEQTKVFLRFYRSASVCETEGVGLGLYLTREIITQEGGYVAIESEVGHGTVTSVFLPIRD